MATLLSQRAAAAHCGLSRDRFRAICRSGEGPRVFAPDDSRPLYVDAELDRWMLSRDDRKPSAVAS